MRRQRKLTPAQRRVLLNITGNADTRRYDGDWQIFRKLVRRGYVMLEMSERQSGSLIIQFHRHVLTSKGLAALDTR